MREITIQLRLPEDLKEAAAKQAAKSGISLNLFITTALAARAARTTPARAKALLERLGTAGHVRKGDEIGPNS